MLYLLLLSSLVARGGTEIYPLVQEEITGSADYGSGVGQSFFLPSGATLYAIELHIEYGDGSVELNLWKTHQDGDILGRLNDTPVASGALLKDSVIGQPPDWFLITLDRPYTNEAPHAEKLTFDLELLTSGHGGWNDYSFSHQDPYRYGSRVSWSDDMGAYTNRSPDDLAFRILTTPPGPQFDYLDTGNGLEIISYSGSDTNVVIPAYIDGKPVTSIGERAFYENESLAGLTIPDGVIGIGESAFEYCRQLERLTLPDSLENIGNRAFADCERLEVSTLPDSLTSIGQRAFSRCHSIFSLVLPDSLTSVGDFAFERCSGLRNVTIGTGISGISNGMFNFCTNLQSAVIPEGITTIGDLAFRSCFNMASVSIPSSILSIGDHAFDYCIALTSVALPDGLTSLGTSAFDGCNGLTTISVPQSVTSIGPGALAECSQLAGIHVDAANSAFVSIDGVLYTADRSMLLQLPGGYTGTYSIVDGVTSIAAKAFAGCASLTDLDIPSGVTGIGESAFYLCSRLQSIAIPASVTNIGVSPFQFCGSLASIDVEPGNTSYSSIGGTLYTIDQSILIRCPDNHPGPLRIPDGVLEIGPRSFFSCDNLKEILLPNSVTTIHREAFRGIRGLSSLIIPASVARIDSSAFEWAYSLNTVYFEGDAPTDFGFRVFNSHGFTLYYDSTAKGFTRPTWNGYSSVAIDLAEHPRAPWLLSHLLPYDATLADDTNLDGLPLLVAYALDLNPNSAVAELPRARLMPGFTSATDTLTIEYFAGREDVVYEVQTCTDLVSWTTEGITCSEPAMDGICTATFPAADAARFLRIKLQLVPPSAILLDAL